MKTKSRHLYVSNNTDYFKRLVEYYKLPWWKRVLRKVPK